MVSEKGYELGCCHNIAMSVVGRFLEGSYICEIDKINYYRARMSYYEIKIQDTYGKERVWFKRRIEGCEKVLRGFGVKIPRRRLEFQFV